MNDELIKYIIDKATEVHVNLNIYPAIDEIIVAPPDDDDQPEHLEGRAIAKPGKPHVILWQIDSWNNAHLKDPPQERGASLVHPDMAERTFILDGAIVHVFPESIKVDGGGRAFVVNDSPGIAITGGLYIKDTEIGF